MTNEYELTLSDYLSIMRRRAPYMIGVFVVALAIAVVAAFAISPTYRATGTIVVETPQVLEREDQRRDRGDLEERINVIKQRAMTREGMLQIINKHALFSENPGTRTTTELIEKMRSRVSVEYIGANQLNQSAIAFTISFEDQRPDVALRVANDLVTLFLDWNIKLRTEGASETTEFLSQESEKLKAEVDKLEEKISAYKRRHSNNLPEQLNLRESMLARAENDLYTVERDIRSGNEELRSLEAELAAAKHGMSDEPSQTLPALKAEYTKLSAIYTESHPDLRVLKRKIDALEQGGADSRSQNPAGNVTNLAVYKIQAKVDAVHARLVSLEQQKTMLKEKIRQNENAMELTPSVAQGLDVLIRDRDSAQRKYDELRNKRMNAQIAQNLESENKSERFSLLEPPIMPEKPYKPDRVKIIALGLFLALAASVGAVMFLESIDKRIRGIDAFTHVLGFRPLVVIPFLQTEADKLQRKKMNVRGLVAAVLSKFKS